jgi:hypothetical protein
MYLRDFSISRKNEERHLKGKAFSLVVLDERSSSVMKIPNMPIDLLS